MSDQVSTWVLRADLIRQQIRMGGEDVWVVKDPLSRQMHYFSAREYALLELLNGCRTLAELVREYRQRFALEYLSGEALVAFLADAKRRGLVVAVAPNSSVTMEALPSPSMTSSEKWWKQPLAIRVPGINPDPLIEPLTSRLRTFFTPLLGAILVGLILFAAVLVVTQFGLLSEHVAIAAHRQGHSWLLLIALVVAATKVIHELAHAITCKILGAQCRAIGIMFLVGIPCLYCDVSDAWMLQQRFKRIMVSAAGMTIELAIAAIATFLWWFSADGAVRDVCVTVMIVCSVSTVLFNGNPLLRYDGYFILSDLVGIPNLGAQARSVLEGSIQRLLWSATPMTAAEPFGSDGSDSTKNRFLLAYAIASGIYRTIVLATIAYMLYRLAERQGLGQVAGAIMMATIGLITVKRLAGLCQRPNSPAVSPPARPRLIATLVVLLAAAALMIPFPQTVVAPSMIHPAQSRPIYATVAGRMLESVRYGDRVKQGDTIARLEDVDARQEHLRLQAECQRLELELDALQKRRSSDPLAGAGIPAITEALSAARQQSSLHHQQMDRLTFIAPVDGIVYAANDVYHESVFVDEVTDPRELLPLSQSQRGSWIEPGTTLCVIGQSQNRELVLWVRQQDVPLLHADQSISLLLPDYPGKTIRGSLTVIATEPVESIDRELLVAGLVELQPGYEDQRKPRKTFYQVRASLDESSADLPIRLTARAQVKVASASLLNRFTIWINDTFRFRS